MEPITSKLTYSHAYEEYQRLLIDGSDVAVSERGQLLRIMLVKYASEHMQDFIQVSNWMKSYLDEISDTVTNDQIKVITFALPKEGLDFTIKDSGREALYELESFGYSAEECEAYVYHWMSKEDFENLEGVC